MGIALVGSPTVAANVANATTFAAILAQTATAGNALVVVTSVQAGSTITVSSVTDDTGGNTYVQRATGLQSGSSTRIDIWDCLVVTGAPTTVTTTPSATTQVGCVIYELSGVSGFDVANSIGNAATATPTPPSITVANAGEAVVTGIHYPSTSLTASQASTGYTTSGPATTGSGRTYAALNPSVASGGATTIQWTISAATAASGQVIGSYIPTATASPRPVPFNRARFRASNW